MRLRYVTKSYKELIVLVLLTSYLLKSREVESIQFGVVICKQP